MDEIAKIEREEHLSVDQRIAIQQAYATLSVAPALSAINPQNTKYRDSDDNMRNGWGLPTHDGM
jgi:hypothetical protein